MTLLGDPITVQPVSPRKTGLWAQLMEVSSRLRWVDIAIFALLLALGAFHFFSTERTLDCHLAPLFHSGRFDSQGGRVLAVVVF